MCNPFYLTQHAQIRHTFIVSVDCKYIHTPNIHIYILYTYTSNNLDLHNLVLISSLIDIFVRKLLNLAKCSVLGTY